VGELQEILEQAVRGYAGKGLNGVSYFVQSDDKIVMSVLAVAKARDAHIADASIIARLAGDCIIVEQDKTNKPLVDALVQAGVPRAKIILAYAGETLETA